MIARMQVLADGKHICVLVEETGEKDSLGNRTTTRWAWWVGDTTAYRAPKLISFRQQRSGPIRLRTIRDLAGENLAKFNPIVPARIEQARDTALADGEWLIESENYRRVSHSAARARFRQWFQAKESAHAVQNQSF